MADLACELGYDAEDFRAAMRHLSPWRLRCVAAMLAGFDGTPRDIRGATQQALMLERLLNDLLGADEVEAEGRHLDTLRDITADVEARAPWATR